MDPFLKISGTTRILGIFGDPVAHSRSPEMQNAALVAAGIDAVYVPFHVRPEQRAEAVAGLRAMNVWGVNVTIPHKEAILSHLDAVDENAARIGAVNTVVSRDGRLIGFNTDGPGFLRSLAEDLNFHPRGRRVLLLGAGGACRAALVALAREGAAWIGIANRDRDRADRLVSEMASKLPGTSLARFSLVEAELTPILAGVDLLVNTTAVGLHGEPFPFDPVASLPENACVYDMVYGKAATPLLQTAAGRGLPCADGRGMLTGQGEEAFRIWTGQEPPSGVMRNRLFGESVAK